MKKMTFIFIKALLALFLTSGCEKSIEKISDSNPPLDVKYEACCGVEPVEFEVEGSYVYVPNVFIIDEREISNEEPKEGTRTFKPFLSEDIIGIQYIVITMETDTGSILLYQVEQVNVENLDQVAWNGVSNHTQELHNGLFNYEMLLFSKSGQSFAIRGSSCAIPCQPENIEIVEKEGCFFPEQFNEESMRLEQEQRVEVDCF